MPKDAKRSQIILPPRREAVEGSEQGSPLYVSRPGRLRSGLFVSLALAALAVIVILTGLLMHFGSTGPLSPGAQAIVPSGPPGPFVKPLYNASQVNALMHLVDGMTYRELANLYVTH